MPFFDYSHPKIIKVILNFLEFASAWKISLVHLSVHYPFTLWPRWPQPFLTTPTPIFFYQLLISGINMYKVDYFIALFERYIFDLKSCILIRQHCFGPIWLTNKLADLVVLSLAKRWLKIWNGWWKTSFGR